MLLSANSAKKEALLQLADQHYVAAAHRPPE